MIVAIDGPAGAGKSSVARALAARLGFKYLDTGAMYRALTWLALREGVPLDDGPGLRALAAANPVEFGDGGDASYANRELDELMAVTAADVQRALRKYVLDAKQVTIEYVQADGEKAKGK